MSHDYLNIRTNKVSFNAWDLISHVRIEKVARIWVFGKYVIDKNMYHCKI